MAISGRISRAGSGARSQAAQPGSGFASFGTGPASGPKLARSARDEARILETLHVPPPRQPSLNGAGSIQMRTAPAGRAAGPSGRDLPGAAARPATQGSGLPGGLKAGMEAATGLSMDRVRVHRNSPAPAQVQAHAYTFGRDIHLAPGQERHLPHEAWHVVQQAQGRVRPTARLPGGVHVNNQTSLEREADRAAARLSPASPHLLPGAAQPSARQQSAALPDSAAVLQRKLAFGVGNIDPVISASLRLILTHKIGLPQLPQNLPTLETAAADALSMARLPDDDTLILDAHGGAIEVNGVPQVGVTFGGLRPEALADLVMSKGLQPTFVGKIYLNGCNSATDTGAESYAMRFQKALALRGVLCSVKGNKGYSQVQGGVSNPNAATRGKTWVNPATQQGKAERDEFHRLDAESKQKYLEFETLAQEIQANYTNIAYPFKSKKAEVDQKKLDANNAIAAFRAQHLLTYQPDPQLRPTLAAPGGVTHYEATAGNYTALPPAVGAAGSSLAEHVQAALAAYDKKWKWSPSAASTAAVPVLTGAIGNFAALLMAVRWYLGLGPRPPRQLVAVGARLDQTSSFYTMLDAQYRSWTG